MWGISLPSLPPGKCEENTMPQQLLLGRPKAAWNCLKEREEETLFLPAAKSTPGWGILLPMSHAQEWNANGILRGEGRKGRGDQVGRCARGAVRKQGEACFGVDSAYVSASCMWHVSEVLLPIIGRHRCLLHHCLNLLVCVKGKGGVVGTERQAGKKALG